MISFCCLSPSGSRPEFIFPSPQQESWQIKCTMCQDVGVGGRKQLGLFCLASPHCYSWQAGQCLCLGGEGKPQDMLDCHKQVVFSFAPALLPVERTEWHDNASLRGKWQWSGATTWGHEKTWSVSAAPTAQRLSHVFCSDVSKRKSTQRSTSEDKSPNCVYCTSPFPEGHHALPFPALVRISSPNSRCLKGHWSVRD